MRFSSVSGVSGLSLDHRRRLAALTNILIRQVVCAAAIYKAEECTWPAAGDKEAAEQYIISYAGIVCVRGPSGCDPGLCASGRGGGLCQGGGPAGALDFRDLAPRGGTRSPFADPASPPHDASGEPHRERARLLRARGAAPR